MTEPTRDFIGYGRNRPTGQWGNGARLAINVVVNYEVGSEQSYLLGDAAQETMTEWGSYPFPDGIRNIAMETMYEYGSRVGVWRVLDALQQADVPATIFGCAVAFQQNPEVARAIAESPHDICSHGYRWEEVFRLTEDEERDHMQKAVALITQSCGKSPSGWYCRYGPSVHTRKLVVEHGGFLYDADSYNDDLPYFTEVGGKRHLVVPYTSDKNDFRFWLSPGPVTADDFLNYLKESFDVLYEESATGLKMMSIGLHPRIIGHAGRIRSLRRFFSYAKQHEGVWFATRGDIAQDWLSTRNL